MAKKPTRREVALMPVVLGAVAAGRAEAQPSGFITVNNAPLADILQALVGELPGSADTDPRVVRRDDGSWLFDGMVALDEVKQALHVPHLPGEDADFHTLGGYLMARLNRVPMVADRVIAGGFRFEVVEMDGRRVDRVLVAPET